MQITINDYVLNVNSRILKKKNNELILTEREIDIIIFLKKQKNPAKIDILQKEQLKF